MQLNIWQGRLHRNILSLVQSQQPDIICLQEVLRGEGEVKVPEYMFGLLDQIANQFNYECFFAPVFTMAIAGTKAGYGNAILSRYPLHDQQTVFTEGQFYADCTAENYENNTRTVQTARVQTPAGSFSVANHHGHWEPTPTGNQESVAAMKKVIAELEKLTGPSIVSGDMNVVAESETMQLFNDRWRSLTAEYQLTTTLSSLGKVKDVACDHVLVSDDIQVKNYYAADELVSDHKAIILDFDL